MRARPLTVPRDLEELLALGVELAELLLARHGHFSPFGVAMDADGTPQELLSLAGLELDASIPHIEWIERLYRSAAERGELRAAAVFYAAIIERPDGSSSDAIAVAAEHLEGFSAQVVYPFLRDARGHVSPAPRESEPKEASIFVHAAGPIIH